MKGKASLRKKKRQRAKNKRLREKGNVKQSDYVENNTQQQNQEDPTPIKDSLHYSFKTTAEDKFIIIKFFKISPAISDSILIRYPDKGQEITYYDKQIIKSYLDSNKTEEISIVNVKEHVGSETENVHRNKQITPLKQSIGNYFIELGIPPEKIRLK
ncbi:MAG: hypothetical protein KA163_13725 [Bacteroidia bacterium]|nr:hypothetical protein [Bacteroidia bacterium]